MKIKKNIIHSLIVGLVFIMYQAAPLSALLCAGGMMSNDCCLKKIEKDHCKHQSALTNKCCCEVNAPASDDTAPASANSAFVASAKNISGHEIILNAESPILSASY